MKNIVSVLAIIFMLTVLHGISQSEEKASTDKSVVTQEASKAAESATTKTADATAQKTVDTATQKTTETTTAAKTVEPTPKTAETVAPKTGEAAVPNTPATTTAKAETPQKKHGFIGNIVQGVDWFIENMRKSLTYTMDKDVEHGRKARNEQGTLTLH